MEKNIILNQLLILLKDEPEWSLFNPRDRDCQEWLGRAHALLKRWKPLEVDFAFNSAASFLVHDYMRDSGVNTILGLIHRAIQDIKIEIESKPNQVFGPGAVYDFYIGLSDLLSTCKHSVLIIDPYLDAVTCTLKTGRFKPPFSVQIGLDFGILISSVTVACCTMFQST
jgi:hypothetical protein